MVHMNAVLWICKTNDCFLLINAGAVVKHKIYQNLKFWLSYLSGNPWLNFTFSFFPCIIYCLISKHNMQLLKIIIKQNTSIYIVLAWKISWMEEPGRLQSMGSLGVGHDWATSLSLFNFMDWRRKWQPTPVFLPGESQGWGSLVGCHLWVTQSRTWLKWLSSSTIVFDDWKNGVKDSKLEDAQRHNLSQRDFIWRMGLSSLNGWARNSEQHFLFLLVLKSQRHTRWLLYCRYTILPSNTTPRFWLCVM